MIVLFIQNSLVVFSMLIGAGVSHYKYFYNLYRWYLS